MFLPLIVSKRGRAVDNPSMYVHVIGGLASLMLYIIRIGKQRFDSAVCRFLLLYVWASITSGGISVG